MSCALVPSVLQLFKERTLRRSSQDMLLYFAAKSGGSWCAMQHIDSIG